jgi:site-specific recombinase XerD
MPEYHKTSDITLANAVDGFFLACQARKLSPHTISDYQNTLRRFLAHVGDVPLRNITTGTVSAFLATLNLGEKTTLNYHVGLAALWTWAIREEHVYKHIPRLVIPPKPKKIVIQPFTEDEIRAMLTALQGGLKPARDRAIILLLIDTGMRASEICGIELADINLMDRCIKVLGKGNKERLLPMSPRTTQAVFEYLYQLETNEKPFNLTRTSLGHHIGRIGKRAGVTNAHPHRFRHTFAVTYIRNGGDPYTLQDILGHTTMEMVRTYLALANTDIKTTHLRCSPVENWKL